LLVVSVFLGSLCLAAPASAVINTYPSWNGFSFIGPFGVVDAATYGQIITVGPGLFGPSLTSFSFSIGQCSAAVNFRGHVYAWNGTMATGPSLFDSGVQTVPADGVFHYVNFNTGALLLTPGQYVLFASTSQDQPAPASQCVWGRMANDTAYPGGTFVFINNGPNPGQWTTVAWNSAFGFDLVFRADDGAATIPTLSEWAMILMAALLLGFGLWSLRGRVGFSGRPA